MSRTIVTSFFKEAQVVSPTILAVSKLEEEVLNGAGLDGSSEGQEAFLRRLEALEGTKSLLVENVRRVIAGEMCRTLVRSSEMKHGVVTVFPDGYAHSVGKQVRSAGEIQRMIYRNVLPSALQIMNHEVRTETIEGDPAKQWKELMHFAQMYTFDRVDAVAGADDFLTVRALGESIHGERYSKSSLQVPRVTNSKFVADTYERQWNAHPDDKFVTAILRTDRTPLQQHTAAPVDTTPLVS